MLPLILFALAADTTHARPAPWGGHGHEIAARAAVRLLPDSMPSFFRDAEDQLVYLNPEPDRWRDRNESSADPAMGDAFAPDHWIHLDEVSEAELASANRFDFIIALSKAGKNPEDMGMLPYRVVELAQRVRSGFRRWRQETNPEVRRWIEQRIVNDAGILGHYVTDGSNPHHTTKHHDGWVGDNPRGFAGRGFHGRFEGQFVGANVALDDVLAVTPKSARHLASFRDATLAHVRDAHGDLGRLYGLDKQRAFGRDNDSPEHKAFAVKRLSAGAAMLRDLWWTAYVTSGEDVRAGSQPR